MEFDTLDYQGTRYQLASSLLEVGRDGELVALLDRFEQDTTAIWSWTRALIIFRCEGDSEVAREVQQDALGMNTDVASYLLGFHRISGNVLFDPDVPLEESEAMTYFVQHVANWLQTPDAIEWVRANADEDRVRHSPHHHQRLRQW